VNVAEVKPGDTAVVMGLGGVGASASLACAASGAERVVVIDPVETKRDHAMALGATHFYSSLDEAREGLSEETWGQMADKVLITVGRMEASLLQDAIDLTGKFGVVVPISAGNFKANDVSLNLDGLRGYLRSIKGVIQNGGNPKLEITKLIGLYASGKLPLENLVTARYCLDDVNLGFQHMREGRNIRGLVTFDHDGGPAAARPS